MPGDSQDVATVHGLFHAAVAARSEARFIERLGDAPLSYGEAARCVAAIMIQLEEHRLVRGDFVVTYLEDSIALALFDLACATMGIVPVPISHQFSLAYLQQIVSAVGAKAMLTAPELLETALAVGVPLMFVEPRPVLSREAAAAAIERLRVPVSARDPFMIQATSGSTGTPKLVVRPHVAFTRYATFLGEQLGPATEPQVFLAVQALTHAFGLHQFTTALSLGASLAVTSELDTNASLRDVWRGEPTVLPMVPRVLRSFYRQYVRELDNAPARKFFPPSARVIFIAGGRGDHEILELCQAQGVTPMEYYGSSEASLIALTPRGQWRSGCAGRVVRDADVRIADDGEVLVKSPGLMLGYHGAPELTAEAIAETGHYRTGDTAELSPDGFLRIRGRKHDAFITPEGSYVYPERIEMLVERLGWARQAMLVGDQRPYLTCLIVVDDEHFAVDDPDGFLSEVTHEGLYTRLASDLLELNRGLERMEKLVHFMLFARPFPPSAYKSVGQGKVRRDRKIFELLYEARLTRLYSAALKVANNPMHLHEDRRYRARVHVHAPTVRRNSRFARRVACEVDLGDRRFSTFLGNISLSGAFVDGYPAEDRHATGSKVWLRLAGIEVAIEGVVVRTSGDGVGVAFAALDDATLAQLARLIAAAD